MMALVACGGAPPPANPPSGPEHMHHEGGAAPHEGHEMKVYPPLDAFHDVFAPVWHTEQDAERAKKGCDQAAAIHAHAQKIEEAEAPPGAKDAAAWKTDAHELMVNADALVTDCKAGTTDTNPRLKTLHEGFHKLLDRAQGKL